MCIKNKIKKNISFLILVILLILGLLGGIVALLNDNTKSPRDYTAKLIGLPEFCWKPYFCAEHVFGFIIVGTLFYSIIILILLTISKIFKLENINEFLLLKMILLTIVLSSINNLDGLILERRCNWIGIVIFGALVYLAEKNT